MTKRITLLVSILLMLVTMCVSAEGINSDYDLLHNLNIVSKDYEAYTGKNFVTHKEFIKSLIGIITEDEIPEDKILEYINTLIGFRNEYKEEGELPEIDDLPDDKIRELLEKYDIQGIYDRTAQIQAIKDKIIANDKFNTVIDKFYNSKFNRELTGEDYDKAKKVLDFFFKNYQNEEFTLDELFDITLPDRFAEYKIDEDTYKVEVKGNTAEFVREL